jgi:hypothetical protein
LTEKPIFNQSNHKVSVPLVNLERAIHWRIAAWNGGEMACPDMQFIKILVEKQISYVNGTKWSRQSSWEFGKLRRNAGT